MRVTLAACLLIVSLSAARAQVLQRIDITEYGVYTMETEKTAAAPGTASGTIEEVSGVDLVEATTVVPAQLGTAFGFRYKLIGQPKATVSLKNVTHIPAPGMRNPQTGNVTLTDVFFQERKIVSEYYRLFRFTEPWEIVPGLWTLEIWDGDRQLVSQGFLVQEPASSRHDRATRAK
ncbi:MAG TPA: DUF3859 domain-containing protein [Xanthobacteraceae bacterium]|nr:DUF3859 domain-containing protein [Xanthobacteraceae bacterium]